MKPNIDSAYGSKQALAEFESEFGKIYCGRTMLFTGACYFAP
jgi:hypothetical protein